MPQPAPLQTSGSPSRSFSWLDKLNEQPHLHPFHQPQVPYTIPEGSIELMDLKAKREEEERQRRLLEQKAEIQRQNIERLKRFNRDPHAFLYGTKAPPQQVPNVQGPNTVTPTVQTPTPTTTICSRVLSGASITEDELHRALGKPTSYHQPSQRGEKTVSQTLAQNLVILSQLGHRPQALEEFCAFLYTARDPSAHRDAVIRFMATIATHLEHMRMSGAYDAQLALTLADEMTGMVGYLREKEWFHQPPYSWQVLDGDKAALERKLEEVYRVARTQPGYAGVMVQVLMVDPRYAKVMEMSGAKAKLSERHDAEAILEVARMIA